MGSTSRVHECHALTFCVRESMANNIRNWGICSDEKTTFQGFTQSVPGLPRWSRFLILLLREQPNSETKTYARAVHRATRSVSFPANHGPKGEKTSILKKVCAIAAGTTDAERNVSQARTK